MRFEGDLNPGERNTVTISIQDVGDSLYDSAVFIKGGSLGTVPTDDDDPPVLEQVAVDFRSILLTYSERLDGNSVPDVSAFTVEANGQTVSISAVEVNRNTIRLTLAAAVEASDSVTLTYTVPGSNPVQDLAGNTAVALAAVAVSNESALPTFQGAAVDGRRLVTYSEALDAGSEPEPAAYTVLVNGAEVTVEAVEIDGEVIILTLNIIPSRRTPSR